MDKLTTVLPSPKTGVAPKRARCLSPFSWLPVRFVKPLPAEPPSPCGPRQSAGTGISTSAPAGQASAGRCPTRGGAGGGVGSGPRPAAARPTRTQIEDRRCSELTHSPHRAPSPPARPPLSQHSLRPTIESRFRRRWCRWVKEERVLTARSHSLALSQAIWRAWKRQRPPGAI